MPEMTKTQDGKFAWCVNLEMWRTTDFVVGDYASVDPDGRLRILGPDHQARETFEPGSWEFAVPVFKLEKRHVNGSYSGIFWVWKGQLQLPRKVATNRRTVICT